MDILVGATSQISESVIGVRVEVAFDYIFAGKPMFGDVGNFT